MSVSVRHSETAAWALDQFEITTEDTEHTEPRRRFFSVISAISVRRAPNAG